MLHYVWFNVKYSPFTALTLLVGQWEGHPACKNVGCQFDGDDFTGALHVLQLLQLSPLPHSSLAPITSRIETFWYWLTKVVLENGRQTSVIQCWGLWWESNPLTKVRFGQGQGLGSVRLEFCPASVQFDWNCSSDSVWFYYISHIKSLCSTCVFCIWFYSLVVFHN